jgi:hypothetical protein
MGKRLVREIVLGSVIDPPQQASLLEIGLDGQGHAAARLATMPSVSRPDFTCSASNTLLAKTCGDIVKGLENVPACRGLLGGVDGHPQTSAMCDALEENLSDKVLLEGIARHGGPDSPRELEDADTKRARALLECICRPEPGMPPLPGCADAIAEPLNGEAYASVVEAAARAPQRADEMSCLAWAASALQSHKAAGMTMSGALHCAFTDETLPAAQVTVASAEEVPCL